MSAMEVATPVYTILELQHRIPEGKLTDAQRERERVGIVTCSLMLISMLNRDLSISIVALDGTNAPS